MFTRLRLCLYCVSDHYLIRFLVDIDHQNQSSSEKVVKRNEFSGIPSAVNRNAEMPCARPGGHMPACPALSDMPRASANSTEDAIHDNETTQTTLERIREKSTQEKEEYKYEYE